MKLNLMKNLLVFAGFAFLLTSCDPDGGIITPPGLDDPTVSLSSTPSGEIDAGSTFTITVNGTPTEGNTLKGVTFYEANVAIPFERITIDGTAASSNPILLFGADKDGLSWTVDIVSHADASTKQYEVEIEDEVGNKGQQTFDVTTAINVEQPTLTLAGNMSMMGTPDGLVSLTATLGMGTFDLASMAFYQGTELIAKERIEFDGVDIDDNPYNLPDGLKDGGEVGMFLRAHSTAGTEMYRFVLTDADGNSVDYEFDLTTGTDVDTIMGVLLNAGGPSGTGGLDLDTGDGTGSGDDAAEIKDLGIDTDMPDADNWLQQIAAANDATLRALIPGENGLLEGFTFEGVASKEMIQSLYDNNAGELTDNTSGVVAAGDMFAVNRGDNYYVFMVTEVNKTDADNGDNYVIDIKK